MPPNMHGSPMGAGPSFARVHPLQTAPRGPSPSKAPHRGSFPASRGEAAAASKRRAAAAAARKHTRKGQLHRHTPRLLLLGVAGAALGLALLVCRLRPFTIQSFLSSLSSIGSFCSSSLLPATWHWLARCIQALLLVVSWCTQWLIEPLAGVLLVDTLILTTWGLLYQAGSAWKRRKLHARNAARVYPDVALAVPTPPDSPSSRSTHSSSSSTISSGSASAYGSEPAEMEAWPKVLVQLPMYNEREVYARAIAAACQLAWPRNRLVIQVLDDSTEDDVSAGMRQVVAEWRSRGVDVRYRHRVDRKGYKAGNLREGLMEDYSRSCKYVAVLDADFEPCPDWLLRSVPYLEKDASLALVQTRWTFSNEDECLLTQLQAVELTWHFWAEQLVSSEALRCFGFNGTAGVWRTDAIFDAGNWRDDTTVEDMDMAVCAAMRGWRMLMVPEIECLSEVPASYSAYRKQQHRWTAGPASLLRHRFWSIACTPGQALGWGCKAYLVAMYMVLRRAVRHAVGALVWILLSLWLLTPVVSLLGSAQGLHLGAGLGVPFPWMAAAFSLVYPASLFCFSPAKLVLFPAYVLFLGGMLPVRTYALLAGLFDLKSSKTWDVTQKLGKRKSTAGKSSATSAAWTNVLAALRHHSGPYRTEAFMGTALLGVAAVSLSCWALHASLALAGMAAPVGTGGNAVLRAGVSAWMVAQGCWGLWVGSGSPHWHRAG